MGDYLRKDSESCPVGVQAAEMEIIKPLLVGWSGFKSAAQLSFPPWAEILEEGIGTFPP